MLPTTAGTDNDCHVLKIRTETALTAGGFTSCEMYFSLEGAGDILAR
jgi:hypothetical protein